MHAAATAAAAAACLMRHRLGSCMGGPELWSWHQLPANSHPNHTTTTAVTNEKRRFLAAWACRWACWPWTTSLRRTAASIFSGSGSSESNTHVRQSRCAPAQIEPTHRSRRCSSSKIWNQTRSTAVMFTLRPTPSSSGACQQSSFLMPGWSSSCKDLAALRCCATCVWSEEGTSASDGGASRIAAALITRQGRLHSWHDFRAPKPWADSVHHTRCAILHAPSLRGRRCGTSQGND